MVIAADTVFGLSAETFVFFSFFFSVFSFVLFWLCLRYVEVSRPGVEPAL